MVRGSLSDAGGWGLLGGLVLGAAAGLALGLTGALDPGPAVAVGAGVGLLVFVVVWRRWWVAIDDAGIVIVRPLRRRRLAGATLLRATNVVWVAGGGHDRPMFRRFRGDESAAQRSSPRRAICGAHRIPRPA